MSKIIQEVSRHLEKLLETGLRRGQPADAASAVYWLHPADLDVGENTTSPSVCLHLVEIRPETNWRAIGAVVEGGEKLSPDSLGALPTHWRRAPLWIACRYALACRGRQPLEEQELIAQVIQILHDQPLIDQDALPSLQEAVSWLGTGNRFPLTWRSNPDLWRGLGLPRQRLLLQCEAIVPIASSRRESAQRILERQIHIELIPWESGYPDRKALHAGKSAAFPGSPAAPPAGEAGG